MKILYQKFVDIICIFQLEKNTLQETNNNKESKSRRVLLLKGYQG